MPRPRKQLSPNYFVVYRPKKGQKPYLPHLIVSEETMEVIAACNMKRTAEFFVMAMDRADTEQAAEQAGG